MTATHASTEPNSNDDPERVDPEQVDPKRVEPELSDYRDADESTPSHGAAAPLANLSGRTLAHFRLKDQLGAGAMSSVYRAADERTGDSVALKVLLPGADGVARTRFRQEANTALQLDHPHIIRSYEIGETESEGFAFIAMELVEGNSLSDLLEQHRQLSIVDSCLILEHVARGLDYAHRRGIVHRDVKPSNILLQKADDETPGAIQLSMLEHPVVPLLSDFGIARALDAPELTTMGRTVGTPSYMAPEQCSGSHEIDGRADIYALGTVFYRCLVGRPPFIGSTTQILYAHVYSPLTIPDEVLVNLPMPVIDILRRSLAKDPRQRYATAAGMAIGMARLTGGIQQPPPAGPVDLDEITATMTALPTTDRTTSSTILVPARTAAGSNALTGTQRAAGPQRSGHGRSSQKRTGREFNRLATGIGIALTVLLILIGIAVYQIFGPATDPVAVVDPGAENEATVPAENPENENESGDETASPDEESVTNEDSAADSDAAAENAMAATPEPVPTPSWTASSAWEDLRVAYLDRNWDRTYDQLIALFRTDGEFNQQQAAYEGFQTQLAHDLLLTQPEHLFWQENAEQFELPIIEAMLFDALVGLAAEANASQLADKAHGFLQEALILRPDDDEITILAQATNALVDARTSDLVSSRNDLHETYVAYATSMAEQGDMCGAAEQLQAAQNLKLDVSLNSSLTRYQLSCAQDTIVREIEPIQAQLSGWVLYSAVGEEGNQILLTRVSSDGSSQLVLEDAVLPSLSPNGERLIYYSTSDDDGLFVLDVGSTFPVLLPETDAIGQRLTQFVEDGDEGPVAWASDNDRIVYGSHRAGNREPHVYVGWAGDNDAWIFISVGADPAWLPGQELIVHNGVDETANQPGLWLRDSDSTIIERLTEVREDLRPTWSPDGSQIIFTSNGRDENWEIYTLDMETRLVTRLTENPAIDVSPSISPDGNYVAFFSNREGSWGIWVTEMDGDQTWRLASVAGIIDDWRKHSLQWIE